MLPPAFLAQIGQRAHRVGAAAPRPPVARRAVLARLPALRLRWPIGRVAAWTAAWMVFEWWAVIGWPDTLERSPAALMLSGIATLVGVVVWRDVRESPTPADLPRADLPPAVRGRVIPFRRVRAASVVVQETEDPDWKDAA